MPCVPPNDDGDPVDLSSGLFVYRKTDLALNDVLPISLEWTYRPNDSRSRTFGIGATQPYDMFLIGNTWPYSYAELVLPDGARVHYDRISPVEFPGFGGDRVGAACEPLRIAQD